MEYLQLFLRLAVALLLIAMLGGKSSYCHVHLFSIVVSLIAAFCMFYMLAVFHKLLKL